MTASLVKRPAKRRRRATRKTPPRSDDFRAELQQRLLAGDKEAIMFTVALVEKLTPELARQIVQLLNEAGFIWLPKVRKLDVASAAELSKCSTMLSLPGLKRLDSELASALLGKQTMLGLNGLRHIDQPTAELLSRAVPGVILENVVKITTRVARTLAAGNATIYFHGLINPSRQILAAMAEGSENCQGGLFGLSGITTRSLTVACASSLIAIKKDLLLDGVRMISAPVAAVLGHCYGSLSLPSLYRLDNQSLVALARVPGVLDLSGLVALPDGGSGSTGIRALMARSAPFYLSEHCTMRRKDRMLLETSPKLEFLARRPVEITPSLADQLHNRKLSLASRISVAESICQAVVEALAEGKPGGCRATYAQWLNKKLDCGPQALAGCSRPAGVSCWDVYYFLSQLRAADLADGNKILEDYCHQHACEKGVKLSESKRQRRFQDGKHLYRTLFIIATNDAIDALRKYNKTRDRLISLDSEDPETGRPRSEKIDSENQKGTVKKKIDYSIAATLEAEILAGAEREYTEAERHHHELQAKGKGNRRRAKKEHENALIWLEWTREEFRRAENGGEKKLRQQEFAEMYSQKYPWRPVEQSRLSRVINSKRRELKKKMQSQQ
jgi:hypothetical protein